MNYTPNLGELCNEDARRDAIHIAVAPVVAGVSLAPGDYFVLIEGKAIYTLPTNPNAVGFVDPTLPRHGIRIVAKDQLFWGWIIPGTITSLRHVWTHPAFTVKVPNVGEVK